LESSLEIKTKHRNVERERQDHLFNNLEGPVAACEVGEAELVDPLDVELNGEGFKLEDCLSFWKK
jgi:hypothetical protein